MSSFWADRPVLVTGATGLLGSHVVRALLDRGADVTCLVRDQVPGSLLVRSGDVDRVQVVRGELEDFALALRVLNEHEVDTVFHLGAQTIVGTAKRSVLSTFEANVRGTWTLLEAVRQLMPMVRGVVVASSDKAYGEHADLPYTEDLALNGLFPYDASKACTEILCRSFHHSFSLPLAVTRCGNLFGAGDLNWNRLIPGTIRWALRGERPVIRSDGTYVRDYFYVEDAAEAYLSLAERVDEAGVVGEAFNFGTEEPASVIDVVRRILERTGRPDLEPVIEGGATLEIREQYLDCSKARDRLGWTPRFTFDDGLDRAIAWYRSELGL